ncbi:MAG: hypothetical protein RLZZ499_3014, partial [Cyanobacteriota bacterium]
QDPIRFKNLLRQAEEQLIDRGLRGQDAKDLLQSVQALDDYEFWQHQSDGLAVVEENLLMPRIMQGSINLNPVVMFFALLVGARIAGLIGVFLAIPIAGVLISLFEIQEMQGD